MPLLRNIGLLARCLPEGGQGGIHGIAGAALAWRGETIEWVGAEADLPAELSEEACFDAGGCLVVPGFIDCHTHLAFGGWRAGEFVRRVQGASYAEIARSGGGIQRTVEATRGSSDEALLRHCRLFLSEAAAQGVTTIECKSGYGLSVDQELRLLRLYRQLATEDGPAVISTFLGAHQVGPEFEGRVDDYVRLVTDEMLPAVAEEQLADFCDVFVETIAFNNHQAGTIMSAAKRLNIAPKLHVDQLEDGGGAELAAELGAVSADHLECVGAAGIGALAAAGTVAVSLPLAALYLNQQPMPARALIDAGVPVAVATDFNPGSAPSGHLPFALLIGCLRQRMTPAEILKGATVFAARALALEDTTGSLQPGLQADFALLDAPDVEHWVHQFRARSCIATVARGSPIAGRLEPWTAR